IDKSMIEAIKQQGATWCEVTLHVGAGTFIPVRVDDLSEHQMHGEWYEISPEVCATIQKGKDEGRRVIAIGTTSMRSIETAVSAEGLLKPAEGWTNLFIYPPFEFHIANAMVTNFHLPKSSLVIMISAFGGHDLIMDAYQEAIKEKYRFYSYGDAMLIL
ncbi:MAG: S-adenosylmethionine:tRNA ribosyltransferase-isomerase, partial [Saprospiraceae bacterium]